MMVYVKEPITNSLSESTFIENTVVVIGFLLSLVNAMLLAVFDIGLLLFIKQGTVGCIKALLLITVRTIINPAIGIPIIEVQEIKWIIILILSVYIIFTSKIINKQDLKKIQRFTILLAIFVVYSFVTSLLISSYPIVAIFKLFSFSFVFFTIMLGVAASYEKIDWLTYFIKILTPLLLISFFTIPLPLAYYINGTAFQGLINHPNMFGIISALYIAALLCNFGKGEYEKKYIVMIVLILIMTYLCNARTSLLAILLSFLLFFLTIRTNIIHKLIPMYIISIIMLLLVAIQPDIIEGSLSNINDIVYKGNTGNVLYSRENQIDEYLNKFGNNPIFGTGFSVPFINGYRNSDFSFDVLVEPGNLILAVLGDTGIIGLILFTGTMISIFVNNNNSFMRVLFFAPILISMGEMVFFSTNNIGMFLYFFYGVYSFNTNEKNHQITRHNLKVTEGLIRLQIRPNISI